MSAHLPVHSPVIRHLENIAYQECWQAMKDFTDNRTADSDDQLWVLEHPSVFTLGQAGKPEHLLNPGDIPVIKTDRGGQVTWHGPGQTVIYVLMDLRRPGMGARELVNRIEQAIIHYLASLDLEAHSRPDAPGVYVRDAKIASLGLRIRKGCSYHGLSLNRDPDLEVFQRINPCGYAGQAVTSLWQLGRQLNRDAVETDLLAALLAALYPQVV